MPSLKNLTESQKLDLLKRVSIDFRASEQMIFASLFNADRTYWTGVRNSTEVQALLEQLKLFRDGCLGFNDARNEEGVLSLKHVQAICDMRTDGLLLPAKMRSAMLTYSGAKYVGELFYAAHGNAVKATLESIYLQFDIPPDTDPIALGWKPSYWADSALMDKLNVPVKNFSEYCGRRYYYKRTNISPARLPHYVGELLRLARGPRVGRMIKGLLDSNDVVARLEDDRLHRLWTYFIVPDDWTPPNWKDDPFWQREMSGYEQRKKEEREMRDLE